VNSDPAFPPYGDLAVVLETVVALPELADLVTVGPAGEVLSVVYAAARGPVVMDVLAEIEGIPGERLDLYLSGLAL
jgi:hypothetical protein